MIYRIETAEKWRQALALEEYLPDDYDTEGFIHCSALEQVTGVANALYGGQKDLVLLCISQKALLSKTRWEPTEGLYYPHIYGPLNTTAVVAVIPFPCGKDGMFVLPAGMPDEGMDMPGADEE